jgi:hypothetical protein
LRPPKGNEFTLVLDVDKSSYHQQLEDTIDVCEQEIAAIQEFPSKPEASENRAGAIPIRRRYEFLRSIRGKNRENVHKRTDTRVKKV